MTIKHLKRLIVPNTWVIKKKEETFITRPDPGAHSFEFGMPLIIIVRDMLKLAHTSREVRKILRSKDVMVDGKARIEPSFITGLMDVISVPKLKKSYRMILNSHAKLDIIEIPESESGVKLSKITGKTVIKKGKMQLNLSDGRNILIGKDEYKIGDSLLVEVPSNKIKDVLKLDKGAIILMIDGKHAGKAGKVEQVKGEDIFFKYEDHVFETAKKYAFVVGKERPAIMIERK